MFLIKKLQLLFLVLCVLTAKSSYAKKITLFTNENTPVANYIELLNTDSLLDGDEIYVSKDKYFIYKNLLGSGGTTKIFEVLNPKDHKTYALRLPMPGITSRYDTLEKAIPFINKTIRGYNALNSQNISIPKMIEAQENKYVLMEKVNSDFDFAKFSISPEEIPNRQLIEAEEALRNFAREIAPFSEIADLHLEQLVYQAKEKKWVILDWEHYHQLASELTSPSPMGEAFFKPIIRLTGDNYRIQKMIKDIDDTIILERKKILKTEEIAIKSLIKFTPETQSASELIELYEIRIRRHTLHSQKTLFDYFLKNQKEFNKFDFSIDDLLRLKKALTDSEEDFLKFVKIGLKKISSIEDLIFFVNLHGPIKDQKIKESILKIGSKKLKKLIHSTKMNIPNQKILKYMGVFNLFSQTDIDSITELIEVGRPRKTKLIHCILSKLIK